MSENVTDPSEKSFGDAVRACEGLGGVINGLLAANQPLPFEALVASVRSALDVLQRELPKRMRGRQMLLLGALGPALDGLHHAEAYGYSLPDDIAALVRQAEHAGMLEWPSTFVPD